MPETNEPEPPLYGWFTIDRDGKRHYFGGGSTTPYPLPPKPSKPMTIRMFVDDVSDVGLWPDLAWDYPGSPFEHLFDDELENTLPVSPELRDSIRSWVDEYTRSFEVRMGRDWHVDHDRRGRRLSEQLRTELDGQDFRVQFRPDTEELRREMEAEKRRD